MDKIEVLISEQDIYRRIKELGKILTDVYKGKEVYAVCVLKGGVFFTVELLKEMALPVHVNFMSVSSYGDKKASSGEINVIMDMDEDLTGKNVLFVEDIVDSGRTLDFLIKRAKERNASDVKACSLLFKPARMIVDVKIDYIGFEVPDKFVVGFGLDYNQKYRNLRYIGALSSE